MTRNLGLVLAALLLTAGLGLHWIWRTDTDLPAVTEGQPAFQAEFAAAAHRGPAPFDARVLACESLGLQLLSFGLLLGVIARELPPRKFAVIAALALGCLTLSPWAPRPSPVTSGLSALIRLFHHTQDGNSMSYLPTLAGLLPWGNAGIGWLVVVSLPAALLSLTKFEEGSGEFDPLRILPFLALVAAVGLLAQAAYDCSAAAGRELCFMAVVLNAAILIGKPKHPVWSALWFLAVLIPILDPVSGQPATEVGPQQDAALTAETRRQIAAGKLFTDPAVRQILPESLRPPLPFAAETPVRADPNASFISRDAFAVMPASAFPLPGRDDLPAWGNWRAAGPPYPAGSFISSLFHSNSGIIQIRVAGTLRLPESELVLRRGDGRLYHPLISTVAAPARWRRINFDVPPGNYQLMATVISTSTWLAFTAPQEIYPAARFANKLTRSWYWWLAAGLLLTTALAALAYRDAPNFEPGPVLSSSSRPSGAPAAPAQAPSGSSPSAQHYRWLVPFHFAIAPSLAKAFPWLSLAGYALVLCHHLDTTAGPNDSGGYLNSAKLLASHHTTASPRLLLPGSPPADLTPYLPGTFVATPDGRLAPTYPVGLPLIIAAVAQILPLSAAVPLVILIQACLGVFLTYRLARAFDLTVGWAWLAAAIIGLSPVYLFQALQPQSDGPALVWVTAAIYFAWTSARHPWRALLAGAATAMAVLIRPSDTLCVVPIAICLIGRWRQIILWVLGGMPGAIFQFWYNQRLYGSGLSTGYGNANKVSTGFGLRFAPLTWNAYFHWLPAFFTPLIFLALIGPFLPQHSKRGRAILAAWSAVFLFFYTFYWCTYDNWYNMRFILPAAPALVILGLWTTRWLCGLRPISVLFRAAAAAVLLGLLIERSSAERVFFWMSANRVNAEAARWARDHLPPNAVVIGKHITGPLFYYTDLAMLRTDSAPAQSPAFYAELAKAGRPVYALTFHWERRDYHWGHGKGDGYPAAPGIWQNLATIGDNEVQAWKRAP